MILLATFLLSVAWLVVGLLAADWFAWWRRVQRDRVARRAELIGWYGR